MDFEKACAFARQWTARVDRQSRVEREPEPSAAPASVGLRPGCIDPTPPDSSAKRREPTNS